MVWLWMSLNLACIRTLRSEIAFALHGSTSVLLLYSEGGANISRRASDES